ncbi:protein NIM1-INTERACTING 2 [Citrus sinensis]|uniref:Uncharacterized protein n=1 Tax=Citrus clementina TaxID=85681 RepID=V4TH16_CITCL|nr:protein NIM1-INTERACTING 2 [Citrus x clementina]XP_006484459.1 protein NIM1-INTERACTING 2-like [Citrus sinensis]ESR50910.1 hypothetical protein CICLE_v10033073mg [Citrus x clementina]KAH9707407.1 protein NIM1-INTERACTING 2 [Citrus sinensis]GAY46992.1 hypothetical protein CUMW_101170 [Citrus unshiu]
MEGEKRRREHNGELEGKRTKGEDVNEVAGQTQTVTEDEVEEFYAILRRIHVAVKYFEKVDNEARHKLTDTGWRPRFEPEDFDEHDGVNDAGVNNNRGQKEEGVEEGEEDSGLDLNSDPTSFTSKKYR